MSTPIEIISEVADAFNCAETIAQLGLLKVTGAVSVYTAHIQQMDQQRLMGETGVQRDALGREVE